MVHYISKKQSQPVGKEVTDSSDRGAIADNYRTVGGGGRAQ